MEPQEAGRTHFGTALRYIEYPMVFLPKLICFCRVSNLLGSVSTALGGLVRGPAPRAHFAENCSIQVLRPPRRATAAVMDCQETHLFTVGRDSPGDSTTKAAEVSAGIDMVYPKLGASLEGLARRRPAKVCWSKMQSAEGLNFQNVRVMPSLLDTNVRGS